MAANSVPGTLTVDEVSVSTPANSTVTTSITTTQNYNDTNTTAKYMTSPPPGTAMTSVVIGAIAGGSVLFVVVIIVIAVVIMRKQRQKRHSRADNAKLERNSVTLPILEHHRYSENTENEERVSDPEEDEYLAPINTSPPILSGNEKNANNNTTTPRSDSNSITADRVHGLPAEDNDDSVYENHEIAEESQHSSLYVNMQPKNSSERIGEAEPNTDDEYYDYVQPSVPQR